MRKLIDNPEYAPKLAELKADFLKLQKSMGDPLDVNDPQSLAKKKRENKKKR